MEKNIQLSDLVKSPKILEREIVKAIEPELRTIAQAHATAIEKSIKNIKEAHPEISESFQVEVKSDNESEDESEF